MSTRYKQLPEARTGYALDNQGGFWSVIVPVETTNLITDPNYGEDGAVQVGGGYLYSDNDAPFGQISYRIEPDPAFDTHVYYYHPWDSLLIDPGPHTFSVYIKAPIGVRFKLSVTPAVSMPPTNTFTQSQIYEGYGSWAQYHVSWVQKTQNTVKLSFSFVDDTEARHVRCGAWQLEALPYPTTFCDGDRRGFSQLPWLRDYRWNGMPYASTSTRHTRARAGGRVVNLRDEVFFHTTEVMGAGLGEFDLYTTSLGTGQTIYDGAQYKGRDLTISGLLYGESYQQLQLRRRKLIDLFKPDITPDKQPVLLQYQPVNLNGTPYGAPLVIPVVYTGGLQGSIDNHYRESLALTFRAYDNWREVTESQYLAGSEVTWDYSSISIYEDDQWNTDSININGNVLATAYDYRGRLLIGGTFTTINGSGMLRFSMYDGVDWNPTLAFDAPVRAIAQLEGPNSTIIAVGGDFLSEAALPVTPSKILLHDLATGISTVPGGDGLDNSVYAITPLANGSFYVGGTFVNTNGALLLNYIGLCDGTSFTQLGSHPGLDELSLGSGVVYSLVMSPSGNLFVGGYFVVAMTPYAYIVEYSPSTDEFSWVGDGVNNAVRALSFGLDGTLYMGGEFTKNQALTRDIAYLGRYNGGLIEEIPGLNGMVRSLAVDVYGNLHVGGDFTNNPVGDSHYGIWNGTAWIKTGVRLSLVGSSVNSISINNESMAIGNDINLTAWGEETTEIVYRGTAEVHPIIAIEGEGTLSHISNLSTGASLYFDDLVISSGETAYLDLTPGRIRFYSNSRSNLMSYLLPSSNLADWKLLPGTNLIRAFVFGGTTNFAPDRTNDVRLIVHNRHHSFDMAGELT